MSYNKNSYVVRYMKYHGIQKGLFSEKNGLQDLELALVVKKVGEM